MGGRGVGMGLRSDPNVVADPTRVPTTCVGHDVGRRAGTPAGLALVFDAAALKVSRMGATSLPRTVASEANVWAIDRGDDRWRLDFARFRLQPMEEWITSDPPVLNGKPCVRDTRLSVDFLLEMFGSGATYDDVIAAYPAITPEGIQAALACAGRATR